jgi:Holliday junction resolvase RusA-like endonuclease
MIIDIPFEPAAKRAPVAAHNPKTKIPIIRDPDRDRKNDIAEWIFKNYKLPEKPYECALEIDFLFRMPLAPSLSNKEMQKRLDYKWALDNKKDLDNMQKLYQDILNFGILKGKIFTDDHIICQAKSTKIWSPNPGILITISVINYKYCIAI